MKSGKKTAMIPVLYQPNGVFDQDELSYHSIDQIVSVNIKNLSFLFSYIISSPKAFKFCSFLFFFRPNLQIFLQPTLTKHL